MASLTSAVWGASASDVWVAGEVANLRRQASGHLYFSLKDDEAVIGAVMWASQARRLQFRLDEGQEVLARGFVEIYPPHGKYQLIVQEVERGYRGVVLSDETAVGDDPVNAVAAATSLVRAFHNLNAAG